MGPQLPLAAFSFCTRSLPTPQRAGTGSSHWSWAHRFADSHRTQVNRRRYMFIPTWTPHQIHHRIIAEQKAFWDVTLRGSEILAASQQKHFGKDCWQTLLHHRWDKTSAFIHSTGQIRTRAKWKKLLRLYFVRKNVRNRFFLDPTTQTHFQSVVFAGYQTFRHSVRDTKLQVQSQDFVGDQNFIAPMI